MCLTNFQKFKQIRKSEALTGYRNWFLSIKEPKFLNSLNQNFCWVKKNSVGNNKVLKENSGIYSYNNNNNYYNNYYNYYNNNNYNNYYNNNYYYYNDNNYNNNNNYYNNNYIIGGIIKQYGKVAIHQIGYRSQFAYVDTLFTMRESDSKGPKEFLEWIENFNNLIKKIAKFYNAKTMHFQDLK